MLEVRAWGPVSEEQLVEAELKLGVQLPEPYRSWLGRTGGGHPDKLYEIESVDGTVKTFVGLEGTYNIADQYHGFDELLPRDLIRIAHGTGGTVALKVKGEDVGSVWWSDHDQADLLGAEAPSYEYLTKLADDFGAFLAMFD
jgi:hypothetical protein